MKPGINEVLSELREHNVFSFLSRKCDEKSRRSPNDCHRRPNAKCPITTNGGLVKDQISHQPILMTRWIRIHPTAPPFPYHQTPIRSQRRLYGNLMIRHQWKIQPLQSPRGLKNDSSRRVRPIPFFSPTWPTWSIRHGGAGFVISFSTIWQ